MGNPRWTRVAEQIRVIVAELIERRIKDPRLGFVTVTDVRMTGDGREASVFYTVLGSAEEKEDTADALEAAKGMIRSQVGRQTGLKFTPPITLVADYRAVRGSGLFQKCGQVHCAWPHCILDALSTPTVRQWRMVVL